MKRLLLLALAALLLGLPAGADEAKNARKFDTYDVVYLGDSRPVLLRLHVSVDGRPLSALYDDYVGTIFAFLDLNKDGFLDKDEAASIPPPASLLSGPIFFLARGQVMPPQFAQLDTNGDGKISKEELAAYYRRSGLAPFQVGNQGPINARAPGGAVAVRGFGPGTANTDAVNDALFKLLDTDGDGKLSKAELAAAPDILMKLDKNDDEMITPDEIMPGAGGNFGGQGVILFDAATGMALSGGAPSPFVLVTGDNGMEVARSLQTRYGDKKIQQPNMRKLSRKDIGLDEAAFKALDADGDGVLDTEELARYGKQPPDLVLNVRMGQDRGVTIADTKAPLADKVKQGRGANDLRLELGAARLDLSSLAAANADNGPFGLPPAKQQLQRLFKSLDGDNKGYLVMNDVKDNPIFKSAFRLMDREGTGKVYEKDLLAYLESFEKLQAGAQKCCASLGISSEGKGLFELIDVNGDGRLSLREMRNAVRLLGELDKDGDGCLSRSEIPRTATAGFRMGPSGGGAQNFRKAIAIAPGGFGQPRQPMPAPRGPAWFIKMDRNGDGDVSRKEFLGTDEQFKEIDTDGDGLISLEEAEAYDKKMREKKK
jgi:Ca2+-binding EF-hand superfamily protein